MIVMDTGNLDSFDRNSICFPWQSLYNQRHPLKVWLQNKQNKEWNMYFWFRRPAIDCPPYNCISSILAYFLGKVDILCNPTQGMYLVLRVWQ